VEKLLKMYNRPDPNKRPDRKNSAKMMVILRRKYYPGSTMRKYARIISHPCIRYHRAAFCCICRMKIIKRPDQAQPGWNLGCILISVPGHLLGSQEYYYTLVYLSYTIRFKHDMPLFISYCIGVPRLF